MGEQTTLDCGGGKSVRAYCAGTSNPHSPGIVIIQEWWGLQDQIKGVCDRYALAGYRAIAPDLYAGKVVPYHDKHAAGEEMAALDYVSATDTIVDAAANHLKQKSGKVGLTGFCLGGIVAIVGAVRLRNIDAASAYYGAPGPELVDASAVRVPTQAHFADLDHWCTAEDADRIERLFGKAKVETRIFRYNAQHAFANEDSPCYDPALTRIAWERDLEFWRNHLGAPSI
jgi:carboxymethylenebutenolidase